MRYVTKSKTILAVLLFVASFTLAGFLAPVSATTCTPQEVNQGCDQVNGGTGTGTSAPTTNGLSCVTNATAITLKYSYINAKNGAVIHRDGKVIATFKKTSDSGVVSGGAVKAGTNYKYDIQANTTILKRITCSTEDNPDGGSTSGDFSHYCGGTSGDQKAIGTSIDIGCRGEGNPIMDMLFAVVRLLSNGVGIIVIGSIIVGGIQYTMSAGDPQASAKAQGRIKASLIALVLYIFSYPLLNYVLPAGFFK